MTLFRDFKEKDREIFLEFCSDFYRGDAVDHPISKAQMVTTFDEILRQGPYLRGLLFEQDREPAGYGQLSFTFSNEAGGFVVLIEELYVLPAFQGRGADSRDRRAAWEAGLGGPAAPTADRPPAPSPACFSAASGSGSPPPAGR